MFTWQDSERTGIAGVVRAGRVTDELLFGTSQVSARRMSQKGIPVKENGVPR